MSITEKIAGKIAGKITDYNNPNSLGARFRAKRIKPLLTLIDSVHKKNGQVSILDIGGTENYWRIVGLDYLRSRNVVIYLLNLPGIYPQPNSPDVFRLIEGNACDLSQYGDHSFDIAHSNSVIEHVGDWEQMKKFANEARRVAKAYFIQTPSYWFPVEPHCMMPFFHWLPKPLRVKLVSRYKLGHWEKANSLDEAVTIVESARLLDQSTFSFLFSDGKFTVERLIGMPKSFIAIKE